MIEKGRNKSSLKHFSGLKIRVNHYKKRIKGLRYTFFKSLLSCRILCATYDIYLQTRPKSVFLLFWVQKMYFLKSTILETKLKNTFIEKPVQVHSTFSSEQSITSKKFFHFDYIFLVGKHYLKKEFHDINVRAKRR